MKHKKIIVLILIISFLSIFAITGNMLIINNSEMLSNQNTTEYADYINKITINDGNTSKYITIDT